MSKVTVHPDALKAAMEHSGTDFVRESVAINMLEAALQWYIDHPQITNKQCHKLRSDGNFGREDQQLPFICKFLHMALSGKPEVPQELREAFPYWDDATDDAKEDRLKAYNLGKGAKQ